MDLSTAFTIFIHQTLRHNGLPFEVREDADPYFYHPKNLAFLRKAIADYEAGRNFTEHELIEVEDDE
jgi:antitoxin component of RelBE/YafQ-DinJ toxin-antitoxin module